MKRSQIFLMILIIAGGNYGRTLNGASTSDVRQKLLNRRWEFIENLTKNPSAIEIQNNILTLNKDKLGQVDKNDAAWFLEKLREAYEINYLNNNQIRQYKTRPLFSSYFYNYFKPIKPDRQEAKDLAESAAKSVNERFDTLRNQYNKFSDQDKKVFAETLLSFNPTSIINKEKFSNIRREASEYLTKLGLFDENDDSEKEESKALRMVMPKLDGESSKWLDNTHYYKSYPKLVDELANKLKPFINNKYKFMIKGPAGGRGKVENDQKRVSNFLEQHPNMTEDTKYAYKYLLKDFVDAWHNNLKNNADHNTFNDTVNMLVQALQPSSVDTRASVNTLVKALSLLEKNIKENAVAKQLSLDLKVVEQLKNGQDTINPIILGADNIPNAKSVLNEAIEFFAENDSDLKKLSKQTSENIVKALKEFGRKELPDANTVKALKEFGGKELPDTNTVKALKEFEALFKNVETNEKHLAKNALKNRIALIDRPLEDISKDEAMNLQSPNSEFVDMLFDIALFNTTDTPSEKIPLKDINLILEKYIYAKRLENLKKFDIEPEEESLTKKLRKIAAFVDILFELIDRNAARDLQNPNSKLVKLLFDITLFDADMPYEERLPIFAIKKLKEYVHAKRLEILKKFGMKSEEEEFRAEQEKKKAEQDKKRITLAAKMKKEAAQDAELAKDIVFNKNKIEEEEIKKIQQSKAKSSPDAN